MINIENEYQNKIDIDYEDIAQNVINEAINYVGLQYECEVNLLITDNDAIKEINSENRDIDAPTDVLSFPLVEYEAPGDFTEIVKDDFNFNPETGELVLGDIIVSYDKVISQSEEYGHSKEREFAFLIAHSMLHLFGYDHIDDSERVVMEDKQREILNNLNIRRN